jgi:hypothetical protein
LASWADKETEHDRQRQVLVCLACGAPLEEPLTLLGSLRCLECRGSGQRLDPELVRAWQSNGAHLH